MLGGVSPGSRGKGERGPGSTGGCKGGCGSGVPLHSLLPHGGVWAGRGWGLQAPAPPWPCAQIFGDARAAAAFLQPEPRAGHHARWRPPWGRVRSIPRRRRGLHWGPASPPKSTAARGVVGPVTPPQTHALLPPVPGRAGQRGCGEPLAALLGSGHTPWGHPRNVSCTLPTCQALGQAICGHPVYPKG